MTNPFDLLNESALTEAFSIFGETINYKSKDIPAIVSSIQITESFEDGGIMQKRGAKFILKKDTFTIPVVGEKIIYNGKAYRILEVNQDAISYELSCDTDAK